MRPRGGGRHELLIIDLNRSIDLRWLLMFGAIFISDDLVTLICPESDRKQKTHICFVEVEFYLCFMFFFHFQLFHSVYHLHWFKLKSWWRGKMIPCSQNMSFTPHKTEKMVDISAPWSYTTYTAYTAKIASILLCAMVIWQNNGVGDWSALDTGQGDPWDCYDY